MEILPVATKAGSAMAVVGLLCGVLYAGLGLVADLTSVGFNRGTVLAFGAVVGMPVLFGALGFVGGAIGAAVVTGARAVWARWRSP